jgi:hypothetical protein
MRLFVESQSGPSQPGDGVIEARRLLLSSHGF